MYEYDLLERIIGHVADKQSLELAKMCLNSSIKRGTITERELDELNKKLTDKAIDNGLDMMYSK